MISVDIFFEIDFKYSFLVYFDGVLDAIDFDLDIL